MTKPGKYVIIPKGSKAPAKLPKGAKVIESDSSYVFFGVRLMAKSKDQRAKDLGKILITDLNGKPISAKGVNSPTKGLDGKHPRGMAFWKVLNEAIQAEPVQEKDRMMHDMLHPTHVKKDSWKKPL